MEMPDKETFIETSNSQESANTETLAEPEDSATEGPAEEPYDSTTERLPERTYDLAAEGLPEGPHYSANETSPINKPGNPISPELAKEKHLLTLYDSGPEESPDNGPRDFKNKEPPDSATTEEASNSEWREIPAASCSSCSLSASLSSEAVEVASGWVLDFMVSCLCQYFKEGQMTEFARSRDSTEAFIHGLTRLNQHQRKKVYMCQFLARIAEGKNLDVQFEKDEKITPLESALLIWTLLKKLQGEADSQYEEIQLLIQVQAIAVCMEKGYFKQATEVLERQCAEVNFNKSLRMKMAVIINGKDPYHPFLQIFSYNRMMNKIKSYVGVFLNESPSDFLMTAAMKVVQTKRKSARISEAWENDSDINFNPMESENNGISVANEKCSPKKKRNINHHHRSQKQLFSLTKDVPWNPEQCSTIKKSTDRRNTCWEHFKNKKNETPCNQNGSRKKQIWLWEEDRKLKEGVKKFGVGNWSRILAHYDFKNRTSVMLKDRWRTMKKLNMVSSDSEG
uniref:Telomeric repeat-binding factor 1 n=1 Tax=Geotrypetes seraphini TaxID=260995 RepID=A0A6P8P8P0_GEOSA|nr:telomeric repeat-binding factor 1 isoform X1 [Geotrypetes seraphini]